jgi:DTW domain-containing protein
MGAMPGLRKTKDPCPVCGLHKERCICASIPKLDLKTRLCLVIHRRELKRTTNTGQLAVHSLVNSEMRVRGEQGQPLDLSDLITPKYRTVLFFPSDDAIELTSDFVAESDLPIQLIVPDGNWRQASKVFSRQKELEGIPKVKIGKPNLASIHLRKEHLQEGMSTLEAIAEALAVIEGREAVESLFLLYQAKLKATLAGRPLKHYRTD